MVRLLLATVLLAVLVPVDGASRAVAQFIANTAVFLLFFLNGLRLPRDEARAGLGNHRLLWPLLLWCYGAMPLAGWALWQAGQGVMPPLLALGFLYLGCLPSTVQSATAYSSLAGGNVASSVVAAAGLNLLGVVLTAPLFAALGGSGAGGAGVAGFHGGTAGLRFDGLLKVVMILVVPFGLGQLIQTRMGGWIRGHRGLVTIMDRGSIAIAVYVAFSGAVQQRFWEGVQPEAWLGLLGGTALLLLIGHGGAWWLGRALRLDRGNRIAMLFAGAQKSIAMGAPLASVLFPPAAAGVVLLPILLYHQMQLLLAVLLAARIKAGGSGSEVQGRETGA